MPSIIISRAPGIALAVALPPEGRIILSTVPWMTRVGAVILLSVLVRSPEATIAPSWRPPALTSKPAVEAAGRPLADVLLVPVEAGRPDEPEDLGGALDVAVAVAGRRLEEIAVDGERRLAVQAAAGRGHDRGEGPDHLRMLGGEHLPDHPAHRGADHVGGRDSQLAKQHRRVLRHVAERVLLVREAPGEHLLDARRLEVEVGGAADVAVVEADHVKATLREPLAEVLVPGDHLRRQAHDQQDRRVVRIPEGLVAEGHAPADVAELLGHRAIVDKELGPPRAPGQARIPASATDLALVLTSAHIRVRQRLAWRALCGVPAAPLPMPIRPIRRRAKHPPRARCRARADGAGHARDRLAASARARSAIRRPRSSRSSRSSTGSSRPRGRCSSQIDQMNAEVDRLIGEESRLRQAAGRGGARARAEAGRARQGDGRAQRREGGARSRAGEAAVGGRRRSSSCSSNMYKSNDPDLTAVVMQSASWSDLLTRAEYIDHIQQYDNEVVARVRGLRDQITALVNQLQATHDRILAARDAVAAKERQIASQHAQISQRAVGAGVRPQRAAGSPQRAAPARSTRSRPTSRRSRRRPGTRPSTRTAMRSRPRTPRSPSAARSRPPTRSTTFPTSGAGATAHSPRAATTARAPSASCCTAAASSPARSTPPASRSGATRAAATGSRSSRTAGHAWAYVAGLRWDTGGPGGGNGPRWSTVMSDDASSLRRAPPSGY